MELTKALDQVAKADGIDLGAMPDGSIIQFKTLNSTYTCRKVEGNLFAVEGGRHLYEPTKVRIVGSKFTFWGSMIHLSHVDVGGYVEMYVEEGPHKGQTLTTTQVEAITQL